MPHKCLRCNLMYPDNDSTVLKGCSCGSVFFLYIRAPKDAQKIDEIQKELETKDTTLEAEIEKELTKSETEEKSEEEYGVETVRIPKEGVYEINIDALMKKEPLVILKQGKTYLIHLPSVFEKIRER